MALTDTDKTFPLTIIDQAMEDMKQDHPLLNVSETVAEKILFSPHIAGITASSFRRSYEMIEEDIREAAQGRVPKRVVNPW